jgi:hypothetical protein
MIPFLADFVLAITLGLALVGMLAAFETIYGWIWGSYDG